MRRPLVWLLAALLVVPGTEALAVPTPPFQGEWRIMPEVFVDEIIHGIPRGEGRRRLWRSVRDRALAGYAPAGLDVEVSERVPIGRPMLGNTLMQNATAVPPGEIVGLVSQTGSYGGANDYYPTAGLLGIHPMLLENFGKRDWKVFGRRKLRSSLSHELGHVLGLNHSSDPSSVMSTYDQVAPSPDDLAGLIGPELGLPDPGDPGYRPPSRRRGR